MQARISPQASSLQAARRQSRGPE